MESEKFPYVWNRLKGWYESLIFNDNAGINGESEHTIKTEEVSISSESVRIDNADVQDLKPEVKVLPNIVDVYALAIFEHCPYENLRQDDMDSLGSFINSKDHLQKNIANCQIFHVYNYGANA